MSEKRRVLVTGASGMLGAALAGLWRDDMDVYATGTHDFPGNPAARYRVFDLLGGSYPELMEWARPDVIVHCASLTSIDFCEMNPERAFAVNSESVSRLAAARPGARIIYVSSDAVFPGSRSMSEERDGTGPLNVYGETKALAERNALAAGGTNCSIRTTLVGRNANPGKQGFVEWILKAGRQGKEITLFDDVRFTPITIWDFAAELEWILGNPVPGILHLSGREPYTKYRFGLALCERLGMDPSFIRRGSLDGMEAAARRSKDQTLSSALYESLSGRRLPGLEETMNALAIHCEDYRHERV